MASKRDKFRESVFKRDNYKCVICGEKGQDAHHIIERRLFTDGGYYIDNGATLCGKHHIEAEQTILSCKEIREKTGITNILLPYHMYYDNSYEYDKWGNIILASGNRVKGELFFDESVQKIMKPVLNEFIDWVKYPRTLHLPFSEGRTKDDRVLKDCSQFEGKKVIITEKLDGENCLEESSLVETENGIKTIKWICDNKYSGKVKCYDIDNNKIEWNVILNWSIIDNDDEFFEIELDNGITILLTENHRIWINYLNCYRKVKDLIIGDDVLLDF